MMCAPGRPWSNSTDRRLEARLQGSELLHVGSGHSRGYRNHARPTRIPAWHLLFDLGIVPDEDQWRSVWKSPESLSDTYTVPDELPPFLSQQALDYYVGEFTRTGIEPANNWYAAVDKSWEHVLPRQRSRPAASTFSDR
jgi:hypothetical protein